MNERYKLNAQLAQMLKGGVIMDVTNPEQARLAETAGACFSSGAGCAGEHGRTRVFFKDVRYQVTSCKHSFWYIFR